jgi:hypothetical protein
MTIAQKVSLAGGVVLLIAAGFGFTAWLQEHDDKLKAQSTVEAQKQVIDAASEQMRQHQEADKARDEATAKQLDAMQEIAAKAKTPQQIAQWIPQQIPMPQPITVNIPPATAENPKPNAIASIPQVDLPILRDRLEKCNEDAVKITTCQADLKSRDDQLKSAGDKLAGVEKERDGYKAAANGGTFWLRVKRAGKWLAIGAVGGAVAVCGSGHCK